MAHFKTTSTLDIACTCLKSESVVTLGSRSWQNGSVHVGRRKCEDNKLDTISLAYRLCRTCFIADKPSLPASHALTHSVLGHVTVTPRTQCRVFHYCVDKHLGTLPGKCRLCNAHQQLEASQSIVPTSVSTNNRHGDDAHSRYYYSCTGTNTRNTVGEAMNERGFGYRRLTLELLTRQMGGGSRACPNRRTHAHIQLTWYFKLGRPNYI